MGHDITEGTEWLVRAFQIKGIARMRKGKDVGKFKGGEVA